MKIIISIRGIRFGLKDQSIFANYCWPKLENGENIFNQSLGWMSLGNCGQLQGVQGDTVYIIYEPTGPIDFNHLIGFLVCDSITEHKTLLS